MDDNACEMVSKPLLTNRASLFRPDLQKELLTSLKERNYETFKRTLGSPTVDPNFCYTKEKDANVSKTCLDIACSNRGYHEYVELLLCHERIDVNKVNDTRHKAPIHFAAELGDVETLKKILSHKEINIDLLSLSNNALHLTIKKIVQAKKQKDHDGMLKYKKIIELLLDKGSDPNIPDKKNCTPIHTAAKNQLEDILTIILEKTEHIALDFFIDSDENTARMVIEENFPDLISRYESKVAKSGDMYTKSILTSYLNSGDEDRFLQVFENIKPEELTYAQSLLEIACPKGFDDIVSKLLEKGADPNTSTMDANKPIAVACIWGYYKILQLLIDKNASLDPVNGTSLLQLAIKNETNIIKHENVNYDECINILLKNNNIDINFLDVKGNTALHYATKSNNQKTVTALLNKGAYIGARNIFNDPAIADINPETLEAFFDETITTNHHRPGENDYEIKFDYKFLVPPINNVRDKNSCLVNLDNVNTNIPDSKLAPETDILLYMSKNHDLKHLLNHPIITSFLYLKWRRISCLLNVNVFFYVVFWISLVTYVLLDDDFDKQNDKTNHLLITARIFTVVGLMLLFLRETFQCVISPMKYIKSPENWLEIILIIIISLILFNDAVGNHKKQQLSAVAILLSSAELIFLIGHFPAFSTNIVMLKTVCYNFLKFLLWYCILIISFALSFYILFRSTNDDSEKNSETTTENSEITTQTIADNQIDSGSSDKEEETDFFHDPGMSLFKTVVMLTGEFDASSIDFKSSPITSHIIFIIFVFMIPIVLLNLLNGLAVSDTQAIKSEAELVGHILRIQFLSHFEGIFLQKKKLKKGAISKIKSNLEHNCGMPKFSLAKLVATRICLFPDYLPQSKIGVKVNKSKVIYYYINNSTKILESNEICHLALCCFSNPCNVLSMDGSIIKAAKKIINKKLENRVDIKEIQLQLNTISETQNELKNMLRQLNDN